MYTLFILYMAVFLILKGVSHTLGNFPYLSIFLQQVLGVFLPTYVFSRIHKEKYLEKSDFKIDILTGIFTVFAGGCQQFISSLINYPMMILLNKLNFIPPDMPSSQKGFKLIIYILIIAIIPAITEEVLFRKFTFKTLSSFGRKTALVITSLIFGLMHFNLFSVVVLILTGFILSYIVYKGKPVIYACLFHFGFNITGILLEVFIKNDNVSTVINNHFGLLNIMAAFVVILFIIYISKERNEDGKKNCLDF